MNRFSFDFSTSYTAGVPAEYWLMPCREQIRDQFSERARQLLRAVPAFGRRNPAIHDAVAPE